MPDEPSFAELFARVQAGDQEAATRFVERYWPHVQRIVRLRLTDRRLRQRLDSVDICQSVFGDFFERMTLGQIKPESPAQLLQFLAQMTSNRVVDQARKHRAARRDVRRTESEENGESRLVGLGDTPSQIVAGHEIVERFQERLGENERWLVEQRRAGRTWEDIADELGKGPEAVRKQHDRAIERIRKELGLTGG
jgi:RNA polymerase sigma factor (sigma-70 family)